MALASGANDLGGTLMNESISRAAGTQHGQELPPAAMEELIRSAGRIPRQRNMRYERVSAERTAASHAAAPLAPVLQTAGRGTPAQHVSGQARVYMANFTPASANNWVSFGGYFLSPFLRDLKLNADFLWYAHVVPSLLWFIYIPHSKLLHIFTSSMTVVADRQKEVSIRAPKS